MNQLTDSQNPRLAVLTVFEGIVLDTEYTKCLALVEATDTLFDAGLDKSAFAWVSGLSQEAVIAELNSRFEDLPYLDDVEVIAEKSRGERIWDLHTEILNGVRGESGIGLMTGAQSLLTTISELKLATAEIFSPPQEVALQMWRAAVIPHDFKMVHFDTVIFADSPGVTSGLPAPDLFLSAVANLGVDAGNTWVLASSEAAIVAADAEGMHTIYVPEVRIAPPSDEVLALAEHVADDIYEAAGILSREIERERIDCRTEPEPEPEPEPELELELEAESKPENP